MANDVDRGCSEHVVVGVGQRLGGSDHDGVSSVYTKGIKILPRYHEIMHVRFSKKPRLPPYYKQ